MLRIGLTGGIACGKSLVADCFAELGAALVDTDRIAREVVAPGTEGLEAVRRAFGDQMIKPDGGLDRANMRRKIFSDPASKSRLEGILHPLIRRRALAELESLTAPYAIVAVPLLLETDFHELVDRILVVDCPEALQLERLMQRDSLSAADARAAIGAQLDRAARLQAADDVIDNSGDIEFCRRQVVALHRRYLDLAGNCPTEPRRAK